MIGMMCTESQTSAKENKVKNFDIIAAILLVIGGLNWGLVGAVNFDLVNALFGTSILSTLVYLLVGISAVYQALQFKAIQRRWGMATA